MKTFAAVVLLVAFVSAEPPPSNSYLPPPSSARGAGYPQGPANQNFGAEPQIVAARNLDGLQGHAGAGGKSGHGSQVNAFGRSGSQDHGSGAHARLGGEEAAGYDHNAAAFARNALEEINSHPIFRRCCKHHDRGNTEEMMLAPALKYRVLKTKENHGYNPEPANYNFGYMVNDYQEGTDFGHHEERQEERAQGEYHVVLPDGRKQTVSYEADERGFKPQISYEDSEDLARSGGYDNNANNARSNQDNGYSNHAGHGDSNNGYTSHGNGDSGYPGNHGNGNARSNGY